MKHFKGLVATFMVCIVLLSFAFILPIAHAYGSVLSENWEGATVVLNENYENWNSNGWDIRQSGGTVSVVGSSAYAGNYGLQCAVPSGLSWAVTDMNFWLKTPAQYYTEYQTVFRFRVDSLSGEATLFDAENFQSSIFLWIYVDSGSWKFTVGGEGLTETQLSVGPTEDVWGKIQVYVKPGDGNGIVRVWFNRP